MIQCLQYGESIVDNGEYGKDNIVYYTHNMANLWQALTVVKQK